MSPLELIEMPVKVLTLTEWLAEDRLIDSGQHLSFNQPLNESIKSRYVSDDLVQCLNQAKDDWSGLNSPNPSVFVLSFGAESLLHLYLGIQPNSRFRSLFILDIRTYKDRSLRTNEILGITQFGQACGLNFEFNALTHLSNNTRYSAFRLPVGVQCESTPYLKTQHLVNYLIPLYQFLGIKTDETILTIPDRATLTRFSVHKVTPARVKIKIGNNVTIKENLTVQTNALASVGENLTVDGSLVVNTLQPFKKVKATHLHIEESEETEFDFSQVEAESITFYNFENNARLKNIRSSALKIEGETQNQNQNQGQEKSQFKIELSTLSSLQCANSNLILESSVAVNQLIVGSYGATLVPLVLDIQSIHVDDIQLYINSCSITLTSLITNANVSVIGGYIADLTKESSDPSPRYTVTFPDFGLIYGNLKIPAWLDLPPNLSCLGTIERY